MNRRRIILCVLIGLFAVTVALASGRKAFLPKDVTFSSSYVMVVGQEQRPFYFTAVTQSFATNVTTLTWTISCERGSGPPDVLLSVTATNVATITWNVERLIGTYWFRRNDTITFSNSVADEAVMTFSAEME